MISTNLGHAPSARKRVSAATFGKRNRASIEARQSTAQAAKIHPAHQQNAFGELRMSRLLKTVPFTLALAALSIFAASCGSSNSPAQVRFVHAIQDAGALDINVISTNNTNATPEFADVSFLGVLPSQPGYTSVPSGSDTVQALTASTTTAVFSDSVNWGARGHYTAIATGFSKTGTHGSDVVLLSIPDNIPAPPSGDVEFRVIHASPSGSDGNGGAVDIYIELNPNSGPGLPITIQGLAYTQASKYYAFVLNPNNATVPPGFTIYVTKPGTTSQIFSYPINLSTAGAARTLVLTDVQGGNTMNTSFLELSDLN
jgi:hypothetical protein